MERAVVTRLYRDESSHETIMLMEGTTSRERFKVKIPWQRAGILAMEAHGLNDRCPLYGMFSQCVEELGGCFGSVVITENEPQAPSGAISLSKGGRTTWVDAEVVELVAFAMHTRIPIYLSRSEAAGTALPSVFEEALVDILSTEPDAEAQS